jgi:hypothetical protein
MVSDAESKTDAQRRERVRHAQKVRRLRWAIAVGFVILSGLTVDVVLVIAHLMRDPSPTTKADTYLLTAQEGPPRALAYFDTTAINDALGQLDSDPNGRTTAPEEVRAHHLLRLVELLRDRQQLEDLDEHSGGWASVHVGTVVRTPVLWPRASNGRATVLVGPAHVDLDLDRPTWRPAAGTPMAFVGQVTSTSRRLAIRPWAVYTRP